MTGAINNLAASLSGNIAASSSASKAKAKETFETTYKRKLVKDEYNARVEETEHIDPVRSLADADQEDAREDRQEHQTGYQRASKPQAGRLDLNA
tara:strand:- start:338 stop:622 length:285 start_codon:yes stop_codon:yes gene_type:complete